MKKTAIIMSSDHPLKILNGTKTMTRRLWGLKEINEHPNAWEHFGFDQAGRFSFRWIGGDRILNVKCPYGGVGDLLWIKETWASYATEDSLAPCELNTYEPIYYKAVKLVKGEIPDYFGMGKWRSSMFMPHWASRITRETKGLRAERLQEITYRDCEAEGIWIWEDPWKGQASSASQCRMRYARLWDSINPKYPWAMSPWVWVISF